ncbi:glycoside hydrolase family 2 TIM barrel-domain containing protein [Nocardia gamkensis]|uniref:glycoside hydrolase family 2 TIM barrel-domain containing protein n=1 Tax=Nocardia gamkensis TaxID=352869 RepID=UPI0037CC9B25
MTERAHPLITSSVELTDWLFSRDDDATEIRVRLPHDAMIGAARSATAPGGAETGWFTGGTYTYRTTWMPADAVGERRVVLRFEGVQGEAELFVNDRPTDQIRSGYIDSEHDLTEFVREGGEIAIRVEVDDRAHPRSRWYPGSGLIRPVRLILTPPVHLTTDGVRVCTRSFEAGTATVDIMVDLHNPGADDLTVTAQLLDGVEVVAAGRVEARTAGTIHLTVPGVRPWSAEDPYRYRSIVEVVRDGKTVDRRQELVGLRTAAVDPRNGLRINGAQVLLRGACVHHDHGILGAAGHRAAELRRVRLLKEAGFNALRSSHHPASRELLDACDEVGMYVLDELTDHWTVSKTRYDRVDRFPRTWREDVERMLAKNRNRPSVILTSLGNEIPEHGTEKGTALTSEIVRFVRERDPERPVTAAVNVFLSVMASMKTGPYREREDRKVAGEDTGQAPGSTLANVLMNKLGVMFDLVARTPRAGRVTRDVFGQLDVAGYNYALGRYRRDTRRHPDRVILGTETLPGDVARAWRLVRTVPSVIGDFVWTGWDYLGESGVGVWVPGQRFATLAKPYPYLLAGPGMFDITGRPDTSLRLAQAAWDELIAPAVAVRPLDRAGRPVARVSWRSTDAVESWSWRGCAGRTAEIEVYSADEQVKLILNGHSLGRRRPKRFVARYRTPYEPGVLVAVGYRGGRETGRSELRSSSGDLALQVVPESTRLVADGADLAFVAVRVADADGVVEMLADTAVTLEVEGPAELVGFGSADPAPTGSYVDAIDRTYRVALAVLRSTGDEGSVRVVARSGAHPSATTWLEAVRR